jgi:hypothetical protein
MEVLKYFAIVLITKREAVARGLVHASIARPDTAVTDWYQHG